MNLITGLVGLLSVSSSAPFNSNPACPAEGIQPFHEYISKLQEQALSSIGSRVIQPLDRDHIFQLALKDGQELLNSSSRCKRVMKASIGNLKEHIVVAESSEKIAEQISDSDSLIGWAGREISAAEFLMGQPLCAEKPREEKTCLTPSEVRESMSNTTVELKQLLKNLTAIEKELD